MLIIKSWEKIPPLPQPIALTIGTFDGIHQGHFHLLQQTKSYGTPVVLTFSNHPLQVLKQYTPPLLTSLAEKLHYLEKAGVQAVILVEFTQDLALQPYDIFLRHILFYLPFSYLVLGKNAAFGFRNEGTESAVKKIEKELRFKAVYIEKSVVNHKEVSSQHIRSLLAAGKEQEAALFLGRHPYCGMNSNLGNL